MVSVGAPNSSFDIFELLQAGKVQEATALLERDPSLASARNKEGMSLLVLAIYYRQREFAERIHKIRIAHKQPLDIFEAITTGDSARIAELAKDGAVLSSYSADGWTPLHLAAAFGDRTIVESLLRAGADVAARSRNPLDNMPLHAALALNPKTEVAAALLDAGAPINAQQHGGHTPLHEAAGAGKIDFIELLVARGADPNVRDDDGRTPRQLAIAKNKTEAADLLP